MQPARQASSNGRSLTSIGASQLQIDQRVGNRRSGVNLPSVYWCQVTKRRETGSPQVPGHRNAMAELGDGMVAMATSASRKPSKCRMKFQRGRMFFASSKNCCQAIRLPFPNCDAGEAAVWQHRATAPKISNAAQSRRLPIDDAAVTGVIQAARFAARNVLAMPTHARTFTMPESLHSQIDLSRAGPETMRHEDRRQCVDQLSSVRRAIDRRIAQTP